MRIERGLLRRLLPLCGLLIVGALVLAGPATADPNTDQGLPGVSGQAKRATVVYQNPHSPGPQGDPQNTDSKQVTYAVMPTGGRWYFECPATFPGAPVDPTGHPFINWPWVQLNMDKDRCGGDGSKHYLGTSSWTTSLYANVVVSPADARCGAELVARTDAFRSGLVGPAVCASYVQMFPTLDESQQNQMLQNFAWSIGTCASVHADYARGRDCKGHRHAAQALQYWPVINWVDKTDPAYGPTGRPTSWLDCDHVPAGHVPASFAGYVAGSSVRLRQLCGLMNELLLDPEGGRQAPGVFYAGGSAPSSAVVAPLHDAIAPLITDPAPDSGGGGALPGWMKIAVGVIGGCAVGAAAGLVVAGPVGSIVGCGVGAAAGVAVTLLAGKLHCSPGDLDCIFKAVTSWAARGMVAALKAGFGALSGDLVSKGLFRRDIFVRLYEAVALLSAPLVLLYGLLTILASMAFFRPGQMYKAFTGVIGWVVGLLAAVPLTVLLLAACDQAADYLARWRGTNFTGLGTQLQSDITSILNGKQFATIADNLFGLLLVVVGALGALFFLGWAITRALGLALAVLGGPLALAAGAGPAPVRRTPMKKMVATVVTLAMFKPLVALVFAFAVGLMGASTSLFSLAVGLTALLGVCFGGWKMTAMVGGGLEMAAGERTHHSAKTGAAAAVGAGFTLSRLYKSMASPAGTLLAAPAQGAHGIASALRSHGSSTSSSDSASSGGSGSSSGSAARPRLPDRQQQGGSGGAGVSAQQPVTRPAQTPQPLSPPSPSSPTGRPSSATPPPANALPPAGNPLQPPDSGGRHGDGRRGHGGPE